MYIRSENLQALQSQQMIIDALLSLMKVYSYNDITITQICQEAQVVRQTFYRNFESKTDILELHLDNIFQKYLLDYFNSEKDISQELENCFEYLILHKDFLILLEKNNLFFLVNKALGAIISKFVDVTALMKTINETKHEIYVLDFVTSTIYSIISIWVKNDFEESTKMLANLAKTFLSGLEETVNLKTELLD